MITRRKFLQGTTAFFTLAGTGITLGLSSNKSANLANQRAIVQLFFRGGMDALNFLIPRTGMNRTQYESKRPNINVPIVKTLNLNGDFGIPDTCTHLHDLYQSGKMAMIHAVGMPDGLSSRSHFESQAMFELGTPGNSAFPTGWLARHVSSSPSISDQAIIPSMSPGNPSAVLQGDSNVLSLDSVSSYNPNSGRYSEEHLSTMQEMYSGNSSIDASMQALIDNINIINDLNIVIPASYPNETLAQGLGLIAQIIKADLGMQVASIDFGGWDTHENSGDGGLGYYVDRLGTVSAAIGAFYDDLSAAGKDDKVVLATQTDFGRRVRENGNHGTDHGTAQAMMMIGGDINGGQVFGTFPGISDGELYLNTDLQMTTDFRLPYSDLVRNFLGNPNTDFVFPGFTGGDSMGLFPTDLIFKNGFE